MDVTINRINKGDKQITGELIVFDNDEILIKVASLELPDLDNQSRISCIPYGEYTVKRRRSPKHGEHFHITNVPNRSFILIHSGNFYTDILGCVIVGDNLLDINGDGKKDVTNSKKTMKLLLNILPDEFKLKIV
jgi:hypothetical protein